MTDDRTFGVKEYAAFLRGPGPDGTAESVEPFKVKWLVRRLRGEAEPQLPGFKAGREWRATKDQMVEAIAVMREGVNRCVGQSSPSSRDQAVCASVSSIV